MDIVYLGVLIFLRNENFIFHLLLECLIDMTRKRAYRYCSTVFCIH